MKLQKTFYRIVNTVIRTLLVLIVSGLLLQSMFSTSFIGTVMTQEGSWQEQTRNIADNPWCHLAAFAIVTALGVLLHKVCMRKNISNGRIFRILSIFVLIMGMLWIMVTQLQPGSDPAKVYGIAMQWREGNFSSYAEGGYLFRYPFQAGIILFYYFLSFVFGVDNYIGLQFVNVIALAAVYVLLSKLAAGFWKDEERLPVLVYAALILWTPLAFYVTYLYGILPGMALSLGAVYCVARYLDSGKYRYVLPACLCMGLATVIKMNCLIYMIAAACFLLYDAVEAVCGSRGKRSPKTLGPQGASGGRDGDSWYDSAFLLENPDSQDKPLGAKKKGRFWEKNSMNRAAASLGVIVLMGLSVMGCNEAVNRYVERLSGYEAGEGFEMLAWVVMGLQETPLGPGGYSGYIGDIYVRHAYDADKVREAAWTDIKKVMTRMSENPLDEGATFFARKNAFQWNDPSFISLDRTKGRNSAIEMPEFVSELIDGRGSVVFYVLMNYVQTLLLAGMLLYLFLNWKSRNLYELMGAVVFLGGYLFHFVWESSASYTIPYFVVMIPYAVKGLADWVRYVEGFPAYIVRSRRGMAEKGELAERLVFPVGGAAAAVVFVILLSRTNLFYRTIALDDGTQARAQFYYEAGSRPEGAAGLPEGYYWLVPYAAQDMRIAEMDGKVTLVSFETAETAAIEEVHGTKQGRISNIHVPDVGNIEQKILFHQESIAGGNAGTAEPFHSSDTGVTLRFRSNEQVLAAEQEEDGLRLTVYMDDGMNMFYESKANVSYLWDMYGTPEQGYFIVLDGMALTYRDGTVTLEEANGEEEQRWLLR